MIRRQLDTRAWQCCNGATDLRIHSWDERNSSFFNCIYFIFREGKGRRKRERNISVWLPLMRPLLGTWPATQACALTENLTGDPLLNSLVFNSLSHTSQGCPCFFMNQPLLIRKAMWWDKTLCQGDQDNTRGQAEVQSQPNHRHASTLVEGREGASVVKWIWGRRS